MLLMMCPCAACIAAGRRVNNEAARRLRAAHRCPEEMVGRWREIRQVARSKEGEGGECDHVEELGGVGGCEGGRESNGMNA
jgi:hypothetical protein